MPGFSGEEIAIGSKWLRRIDGKKEAIDRMPALQAYTKNAAYLLWKEQELGSLKAGKIADMVVFADDFLGVADEELKDVRILMTIANGEIVYMK